MNFSEMRDELRSLLKFGGWGDTDPPPNHSDLINDALREWSWAAEYKTGQTTFNTTASTAEYTLTTPPDWKLIKDAYYGSTVVLRPSSEDEERRKDPMWRMNATLNSALPEVYWMPTPNVVRLYPTPNASGVTVTVYGVRADTDLASDSESPACPAHYHRYIVQLAAALHAKRYAVGEERERVLRWEQEALSEAEDCRLFTASQNTPALQRTVRRRGVGRVSLG